MCTVSRFSQIHISVVYADTLITRDMETLGHRCHNPISVLPRVTNCPVFPGHVLFSYNNFYPYRGGITYFKCIEINKVYLSKLRVSFE